MWLNSVFIGLVGLVGFPSYTRLVFVKVPFGFRLVRDFASRVMAVGIFVGVSLDLLWSGMGCLLDFRLDGCWTLAGL